MIKQPFDLDFTGKKMSMLLYGTPGIGKTTLALSAPDPILIDFDHGIARVKAYHRTPTILCSNYEEVLEDIESPEVRACKTLIIDTGGAFVTYLQDWAMRSNPAVNKQKNGAISLKGFGAVKQEFQRFTSYACNVLNKNVIYIFHADEQKDKDGNPQQRLLCEGAARNLVWQSCDLGGYMQMIGTRRVLSFTPSEEYYAKGCYGIEGTINVPALGETDKNDLLTRLFDAARDNITSEAAYFAQVNERYNTTMQTVRDMVDAVTTAEDATEAAQELQTLDHVLTSKREASAILSDKATKLGFVWDKERKAYTEQKEAE